MACETKPISHVKWQLDDLVQDCSISIANVLGISQSCTKPSKQRPNWLVYPCVYGPTLLIEGHIGPPIDVMEGVPDSLMVDI